MLDNHRKVMRKLVERKISTLENHHQSYADIGGKKDLYAGESSQSYAESLWKVMLDNHHERSLCWLVIAKVMLVDRLVSGRRVRHRHGT